MNGNQKLSRFIVHRIGDTLDLFLESLVELTQRLYPVLSLY